MPKTQSTTQRPATGAPKAETWVDENGITVVDPLGTMDGTIPISFDLLEQIMNTFPNQFREVLQLIVKYAKEQESRERKATEQMVL